MSITRKSIKNLVLIQNQKKKISIPYNIQNYVIQKCTNKGTGGKDGISLNFLVSQINHSKIVSISLL